MLSRVSKPINGPVKRNDRIYEPADKSFDLGLRF